MGAENLAPTMIQYMTNSAISSYMSGTQVPDDRKTVLLSKILSLKNSRMIDNAHSIMFAAVI
jgi:hypothetical protein